MGAFERYNGVRGKERVSRITRALQRSGATILSAPDPTVAPFEYSILTPEGETLDIICYAFTANKYGQGERPHDEHRMQVKYGSDFTRPHKIYVDPRRRKITLMFGVHEELDLFVAVDPWMHRVTWFSSSIEFKDKDLQESAHGVGWHGWDRERVAGRRGRRRVDPMVWQAFSSAADLRAEVLFAFRPEQFLRYVQLERVSTGLDPGERLLLVDRIGRQLAQSRKEPSAIVAHPLEEQLGLSTHEILEVIRGRGRLLTAVLGGVAEQHLERYLQAVPDVAFERLDKDNEPDFKVRYRGRSKAIRVECKNVRARPAADGGPWVELQKTRASKSDPCSRFYAASQFELLAACLHPISERWDFRFRETAALKPHKDCPHKLAVKVLVEEPAWRSSLPELLERLTSP